MPLSHSIFLIGYRGTGKSTIAELMAARLGADWVDSDDAIEQSAGCSIAEIFRDQGEPVFRDLEEQTIANLAAGPARVLSLGGGAVLRESTRQRLKKEQVVWLQASAAVLAERLSGDSSTAKRRPSLTGQGTLEEIEQVLAVRTPIYQECATLVVDTDRHTPDEVAGKIVEQLSSA